MTSPNENFRISDFLLSKYIRTSTFYITAYFLEHSIFDRDTSFFSDTLILSRRITLPSIPDLLNLFLLLYRCTKTTSSIGKRISDSTIEKTVCVSSMCHVQTLGAIISTVCLSTTACFVVSRLKCCKHTQQQQHQSTDY
jgi:hypothetical protein